MKIKNCYICVLLIITILLNGCNRYKSEKIIDVKSDTLPNENNSELNNTEHPITTVDFMKIHNYMNILVDYFHSPYKIGDSISDINIMYLCASLCCNGYLSGYKNIVNLNVDESETIFSIPENELDRLAKLLFGNISILDYNHFLPVNGYYDKYIEESSLYTFTAARDYWNGDNYYIDIDNSVVSEDDDELIVKADVYPYDSIASQGDNNNGTKLSYTFEKIIDREIAYYRLLKINESPS
jgi:hypothetical protein